MSMNERIHLYSATAATGFVVLVGGTSAGWLVPEIRLFTTVLMATVIIWWIAQIARGMDAIDAAGIGVVVCIGIAAVLSSIPRLSVDAFYACLALVAIFGLSRRLSQSARNALTTAFAMVLSVVSAALLFIWISTWWRWTDATSSLPPLSLRLPSAPFGHPHDAALLVGLLLPSAFGIWRRGSFHRLVAVGVSISAGAVLIMAGGRGVWLAAVSATAITILATTAWRRVRGLHPRLLTMGILSTAAALAVVVLSTGLADKILRRLMTTETIAGRLDIWSASLQAWGDDPMTGTGPGTFQFALQATDYFQHAVYAPKHADNAYVQLVSEMGIVGVIGLLVFASFLASAWRVTRPPAESIWAVAFGVIAGLTANPWALGYCATLLAYWAGVSVPTRTPGPEKSRWATVAVLVPVIAIAAVPISSASAAAVAFDRARTIASRDDPVDAIAVMHAVLRLDPLFPLYHRELGTLLLADNRPAEALLEFRRAVALNRWDDAAWRGRAIASLAAGNPSEAVLAAAQAVVLQASDPMNYATVAYVASRMGDIRTRDRTLAQLVTLAPWSSADPNWLTAFPGLSPAEALQLASKSGPTLHVGATDRRWVDALVTGTPGTRTASFSAPQAAFVHLLNCMPLTALSALRGHPQTDAEIFDFWFARAVVDRALDRPIRSDLDAVAISSPAVRNEGSPVDSPLVDEASYSRRPINAWDGVLLPSLDGGRLAWMRDPQGVIGRLRPSGSCP